MYKVMSGFWEGNLSTKSLCCPLNFNGQIKKKIEIKTSETPLKCKSTAKVVGFHFIAITQIPTVGCLGLLVFVMKRSGAVDMEGQWTTGQFR